MRLLPGQVLANTAAPLYFTEIYPMRYLLTVLFLFLYPFLYSCKERKNAVGPAGAADAADPAQGTGAQDFYKLDTMTPEGELFFPVFELSSKTTAFVVLFSQTDQKGSLDSIFDQTIHMDNGAPAGCEIYDTTGAYQLMRSGKLESAIKKHYPGKFYIYGTQGKATAAVKSIVFGLDDCRSNLFAFCLDNSDLTSIGHPLFCSYKNIDLQRADNYNSIEKTIGAWLSREPGDYDDSIKLKVVGNTGNFYFTYNDDFLWGKNPDGSKCKFPTRSIYVVDGNNHVRRYWAEDLDLFGVGCD
jgi:hypothetical protein